MQCNLQEIIVLNAFLNSTSNQSIAKLSLFKKQPSAIFVSETNPKSPQGYSLLEEIILLLVPYSLPLVFSCRRSFWLV